MSMRIALIVDGARFHAMATSLGRFIDFNKLKTWASDEMGGGLVVSPRFYTQVPDGESSIVRRIDYLENNGWGIRERQAVMVERDDGRDRMVGDMDTYMVADMVEMALGGRIDHVFLFSGSAALTPGVEILRREHVGVTVVGTHQKGMNGARLERSYVTPDLRRAANGNVVELADIAELVGTPLQHRDDREDRGGPRPRIVHTA